MSNDVSKTKAQKRREASVQNNGKSGRGSNGRFAPGNPWAIPKGQTRNPGGRPKMLSGAYREWLAHEDEQGITNAAKLADAQGRLAFEGNTGAAREIRQATEGDVFRFAGMDNDELLTYIAQQLDAAGSGDIGSQATPAEDTPVDKPG
jgi:hypothetical protein